MWQRVVHRADDGMMLILPVRDVNPCLFASLALATFCYNHQVSGQFTSAFEYNLRATRIARLADDFGRHVQMNVGMFLRRFIKHAAQISAFEHLAQKSVLFVGRKIERSCFKAVAHPDFFNRTTFASQSFAHADGLEQFVT